ncbi:MAG: ShlB/FhaC/HecB family hemolysin secretion/activation protein, partial [Bacteroidota bacterium]
MANKRLPLLLLCILMLQACATHHSQVRKAERDWEQTLPPPEAQRIHTMYLLGDAGYSTFEKTAPPVRHLGEVLKTADENSSLVVLGDNIYPDGLVPEDDPTYPIIAHRLKVQLDIIKDFKGQSFIIPGNHEYVAAGIESVKWQEEFVEDYLDKKDVFRPKNGCSGPEKEKVHPDILTVFIDSQWWIADWDENEEMNEGCPAKSKTAFLDEFQNLLKKNRERTVVVAIHHPPFTSGSHGGQYSWKDHLFPLTLANKNLYIPLPGLGSLLMQIRATLGIRQDANYPPLAELRDELMSRASDFDNVIFVSGHDHNLQYLEAEGHPFIVSGAGSKETPARASGFAQFTYGGHGYAQLDFYEDGSTWAQFWGAGEEDESPRLLFRKKIMQAPEPKTDFDFTEYNQKQDSIALTLYDDTEKSGFHRFLWGELYRDVYGLTVKVPVLDLAEHKGGLQPIRKGGGNQTNSLRLADKDGKQYVLRSMQKDAGRILGGVLRGTFVVEMMRDVFTYSHPYAAFVVPSMAEAAGIYHTNPKLYYLAKQPALGKYNDIFGGGLYLFEERPANDRRDVDSFGNSEDIVSTPDAMQDVQKDHDNKPDYDFIVRSRLFDMTIGDWDRHGDQWRWATEKIKEDGEKYTRYRPIPRDRDQPFSKFDGVLMQIINKTVPLMRQFQSFGPEIPRIKWYNNYARHFDRVWLVGADWATWEREVQHIQQQLTDEIIEAAIQEWPPTVYEANGEEIIAKIKGRRDNLLNVARGYYERLAKTVDIVGTNKDDIFEVERGKGFTKVQVFNPKKKGGRELHFERTFFNEETDEIHIYGLDGDDEFNVKGKVPRAIKLRLIGGFDKDVFDDVSEVGGWGKKTLVYDEPSGSKIKNDNEIRDKRSKRYTFNEYDHKDNDINYGMILPQMGFNPDDGFQLGAFANFFRYGFKKKPYAQKHHISAGYSFATGAIDVAYQAEYIDALGKWDILTNLEWNGEQFVINFFGFGNNTENPRNDELSFNRVRKGAYFVNIPLRYRFRNGAQFQIAPLFESHEVERTSGRFVSTDDTGLSEASFDEQRFWGIGARYLFENMDVRVAPTHGFRFLLDGGWQQNAERSGRNFGFVASELTFYQRLTNNGSLVWATQFGAKHIWGQFEFYQAATIGGREALRGFRQERFAGKSSFYNSNDLRLRLINEARTYVAPLTFGLFASGDYGRVWIDGEDSSRWHNSYGGGIWLSTLDALTISAGFHHSDEGNRVLVRAG